MKYPPPHHQSDDRLLMLEVIRKYPLATIVSIKESKPFISHLPLIYRETDKKLIGHIDIYNPQTNLLKDNRDITVIFSGPQSYISPTVYNTTQLPTWNYVKVHLTGMVNAIESREALKESLITMTEFLEAPEHNYVLKPDNPKMERALDYIKMFEITIKDWEGKFKLSQDKKRSDRIKANDELVRKNKKDLSDLMKRLNDNRI